MALNLEQALRKTTETKKFREEVSDDVNKQKAEIEKAKKEREGYFRLKDLTESGSSFTKEDKNQAGSHNRSGRTPAGDGLPKGPRGGRFNGGKGLERLR